MYFYVDESGHTGANLFDSVQPTLFYGVLSSSMNVDVLVEDTIKKLRARVGVERIHATDLGNGALSPLVPELISLHKRLGLRFDCYRVSKPDHAIISFFDQVFDQGMNPAVTWTGYWTPLRYILLLKLAHLFDEDLAKKAWKARLETQDKVAHELITEVCLGLHKQVKMLPDARSIELIGDALLWAAQNPEKLSYNAQDKDQQLSIMPNVIGFQSVMHGISSRLRMAKARASRIVVDQQTQFNKAQRGLHEFYLAASKTPWLGGPGLPKMDLKGTPDTPIVFAAGTDSCGLELVDIYLWSHKRAMEGKDLSPELGTLVRLNAYRGRTDEISLAAIANRWTPHFESLPDSGEEAMRRGRQIFDKDEVRRKEAVRLMTERSGAL